MVMKLAQLLLASVATAAAVQAQIRLPSLPLPGAPLSSVPQNLSPVESETLEHLSEVRRFKIRQLVRANRRTVDTDPNGEPIVRSEILALGATDDALVQAESRGFVVDRQQSIAAADIRLLVLKAPVGLSTQKALRGLRDADPKGLYDYNHIYSGGGAVWADPSPTEVQQNNLPIGLARPHIRIGLLDTGVDVTHPVFRDSLLHTWGCGERRLPSAHGTAVASLLVAHASADLYAADVYCDAPTGGAVDAIVAAFGWMAQEQVSVINVSLVGPKNILLERVVNALLARGHVLVAAVGNDGPAAPPLYPAAYDGVVGVTAVDSRRRVLIEAERGPQVTFAALGADIKAANLDHGYSEVRGTSFAAPTVAALLAAPLLAPDKDAARAAIAQLAKSAIDLGPAGKDFTYGFGLVGAEAK
jgi:subtilisin family serine protease